MSELHSSTSEKMSQVSFASEVTPIMGSANKSPKKSNPVEGNGATLLSHDTSLTVSESDYDKDEEMTGSKAIFTYTKENFTSVIIAFLLLVICALTGENASNRGEAANLVEDQKSALKIQWRPCQMYLDESINDVKVIQTSLGDPSTHWGEIACLVRNENPFKFKQGDDSQWNWLFETNNETVEPIEYGMPSADIKVDFDAIAHPDREPIMGFGGAFTEASALNYMTLSDDGREAVMSLLFGKDGLGYSLGRVHMNSCDFSIKSYNFDDIDGDFDLINFDTKVEHDVKSGMIEMMLQANQKLQEEWKEDGINIMASPWSPPAWMKRPTEDDPKGALHATGMDGSAEPNCLREGTGPDSRYAASWALYFSKFLDAYKAWGVNLFAVTVQNEPEFPAPWEACAYNPDLEAEFISNHLGPILRRDHPDIKLLIFDHNKDHAVIWGSKILNETNPALKFVDGTAIHWYAGGMDRLLDGAQGAPNMHRYMSMLKAQNVKSNHLVLGSEACHCPTTGYAGGDMNVAWARAERYGHTILSDLAAGSNGWVEWNLVLDAKGGPNHLGNLCDSPILAVPYRAGGKNNITVLPPFDNHTSKFGPIVGDSRTMEELNAMGFPAEYLYKGVVVQPMFYYMGHISRHVRPGSRAVHALVDHTKVGQLSRTFRKIIDNVTIAGGGINDLARTGVEVTLWPCEGSTRQQWILSDDGKLQVFGHDWLGKPTVSCISSKINTAFEGLLLSTCDKEAGLFHYEDLSNNKYNIQVTNAEKEEGQNCLSVKPLANNGGAYGPRGGAQVVIGNCNDDASKWNIDEKAGEISSNIFGDEVCVTTGWPFLQVGAFLGQNEERNKTIIVLNEASEPANYVLRNGHGEVFMTNSIQSHAIQTVTF